MNLERREYEERAVRSMAEALAEQRKVLAVSPTGSGKTVMAAMLLKQGPWRRIVFLAHRHELIDQAYATLSDLGVSVGVMMAQDEKLHGATRVNADAMVQVASVQTLGRRGVPEGVDLLVFDEAHRVMADSYQRIAAACPDAKVLGLTATPCRLDGKGLGSFFEKMLVLAEPSELYEAGYLAKPTTFSATPEVLAKLRSGMKGARVVRGDYSAASLAKAVEHGFLIGKVVDEALRIAPHVRKVVFACNVRHSMAIVDDFLRRGVRAAHLDGETLPDERSRILADLRAGRVEVVSNVDVLSEGWDLPALGAVIIARPTKSLARYLQMVGRGQRTYKGRVPIVIDHGANVDRFMVPGSDIPWSLDQGFETEQCAGVTKTCIACQLVVPGGCTMCPGCGAALPRTAREEREEIEARLEEVKAEARAQIRMRLSGVAVSAGAPEGWVDRVLARV